MSATGAVFDAMQLQAALLDVVATSHAPPRLIGLDFPARAACGAARVGLFAFHLGRFRPPVMGWEQVWRKTHDPQELG